MANIAQFINNYSKVTNSFLAEKISTLSSDVENPSILEELRLFLWWKLNKMSAEHSIFQKKKSYIISSCSSKKQK